MLTSFQIGKHKFIGETIFSRKELEDCQREFILSNNGQTKGFGTLKLLKYERGLIPKFIDFIMMDKEKLNLIIGIDFTKSNGNPESFESLHNINNDKLNQYQLTLKVFGDIVLNYTDKRYIEMFGFGGILRGKIRRSFGKIIIFIELSFLLNENEKHPLKNINDILQVYDTIVKEIKLSWPSHVTELLKYAKKQSKITNKDQHNSTFQQYLILLIILVGKIDDISETQQLISNCEQLPISIIFIGVGDNEWQPNFKQYQRQIYQFESFKEYKNDPVLLMQAVLKKIPEQYLKYKKINGRASFYYFHK